MPARRRGSVRRARVEFRRIYNFLTPAASALARPRRRVSTSAAPLPPTPPRLCRRFRLRPRLRHHGRVRTRRRLRGRRRRTSPRLTRRRLIRSSRTRMRFLRARRQPPRPRRRALLPASRLDGRRFRRRLLFLLWRRGCRKQLQNPGDLRQDLPQRPLDEDSASLAFEIDPSLSRLPPSSRRDERVQRLPPRHGRGRTCGRRASPPPPPRRRTSPTRRREPSGWRRARI